MKGISVKEINERKRKDKLIPTTLYVTDSPKENDEVVRSKVAELIERGIKVKLQGGESLRMIEYNSDRLMYVCARVLICAPDTLLRGYNFTKIIFTSEEILLPVRVFRMLNERWKT